MPQPKKKAIRVLADRLVDESGIGWDRVRGAGYELTRDELERLAPSPTRLLCTGGYGSPVTPIEPAEFNRVLASFDEPRITAYVSAGRSIWVLNTSDC